MSKDFFVQFVGDGCLVDKARDGPDLVWSTFYNSIKNTTVPTRVSPQGGY